MTKVIDMSKKQFYAINLSKNKYYVNLIDNWSAALLLY